MRIDTNGSPVRRLVALVLLPVFVGAEWQTPTVWSLVTFRPAIVTVFRGGMVDMRGLYIATASDAAGKRPDERQISG